MKLKVLLLVIIVVLAGWLTFFQTYIKQQKAAKLTAEIVNAQKFTTYKEGKFQINYPYWSPINIPALIAVSNQSCTFIITKKDVPIDPGIFSLKNQYVSGKQTYTVLFMAKESLFESVCRPFVEKTLNSVKLK